MIEAKRPLYALLLEAPGAGLVDFVRLVLTTRDTAGFGAGDFAALDAVGFGADEVAT